MNRLLWNLKKQELLMASDAGYGFICKFEDLIARNKAGKALISLPENAKVLKPETLSESALTSCVPHFSGSNADFSGTGFTGIIKRERQQNHQYSSSECKSAVRIIGEIVLNFRAS